MEHFRSNIFIFIFSFDFIFLFFSFFFRTIKKACDKEVT